MNKKFYPPADLDAEYKAYVEGLAIRLLNEAFELDLSGQPTDTPYKQALHELKWSSWLLSPQRRLAAYKGSGVALDLPIKNLIPTDDELAAQVARHVELRCMAKPIFYKLAYKAVERWVVPSDLTPGLPDLDDEVPVEFSRSEFAEDAARSIQRSYRAVGVAPPLIEIVAFEDGGKVVSGYVCHEKAIIL